MWQEFWLCLSALLAGAINAIAGGGTLLTFPALGWALGESDAALRSANVTSTLILLPGSLASMWGYRREFRGTGPWLSGLIWPSILGGIVGALLLRWLPAAAFQQIVPWLILLATLLFLGQPLLSRQLHLDDESALNQVRIGWGVIVFQLLIGVYGGYFGAGIGILMLSSLAYAGLHDIHQMNALKTLFASIMNGMAVAMFLASGEIAWSYVPAMLIAAVLGGWGGSAFARRIDRRVIRWLVIAVGFGLSTYYFAV